MTNIIDEVYKKSILKDLEGFGLKGHAATVYLALLGVKEVGISALENKTGLHRQLIYNALHVLEGFGLAKHSVVNGRRRFAAHPPRRLQSLVDEKQRLAQNLIERLSALAAPKVAQEFEVFQGESAYVAHEMQMLVDAEEGETLSLIAGNWKRFYSLMDFRMEKYEKLRASKRIGVRLIGPESQQSIFREAKAKRLLFDYRVLPGLDNGLMDTNIWEKSIALNFFGDPVVAFVLKNEEVARSQKVFFESLWKIGRE